MANYEAFCPGHFIKHKPLISEECNIIVMYEYDKISILSVRNEEKL